MTTQGRGASRLRIVFFGTPHYAVPALRALAGDERFDVALVVTQPDRPAGRGHVVQASPVKDAARALEIPVYQPATLRDDASRRPLAAARADLFVVAAFGLIFGRKTLALPRLGCLNLHASLLPQYRGAAPVAAAILAGAAETGLSLMVMEPGLDTGPVVAVVATPVLPRETTAALTARLGELGAALAVSAIPGVVAGDLTPRPQPACGASHVRQLVKADGWLDWRDPAQALERRVRAMWNWPRAWTTFGNETVQVHEASVVGQVSGTPGSLVLSGGVVVACGSGGLRLDVLQPAGARPMSGAAWVAGRHLTTGDRLGVTGAPEPPPPLIVHVAGTNDHPSGKAERNNAS